jgi:hypothetical protein
VFPVHEICAPSSDRTLQSCYVPLPCRAANLTARSPSLYTLHVKVRSFANKALKRLYQQDNPKGLPADAVDKIKKMLAFMDDMEDVGGAEGSPGLGRSPPEGTVSSRGA